MKSGIKSFFNSHPKLKQIAKKSRKVVYGFFDLAYPIIKSRILAQIRKLDQNCQPFLLTRHDLGCWLHSLHYAHLRNELKGNVIVVILSSYYREIQLIAKILFPNLTIISA